MKAFVLRAYGSAERLRLEDVDQPVPAADEVLIRVRATSVNPYDWHTMRGQPYVARLMGGTLGPRRPRLEILGADVAGVVEEVGSEVKDIRTGDEVYALAPGGGFAEYARAKASAVAPKPAGLSFEEAAAVPLAACTALIAVRDQGGVRPGHRVLVTGASGGVGSFAVQIARALGATVTGVCGGSNLDLVRSIGAADAIDYGRTDFTLGDRRYDVMIDIAGGRPLRACRRVLAPDATVVLVGGPAGRWLQPAGHMFAALAASRFASQKLALVDLTRSGAAAANLRALTGWIESGAITPVIGRRYAFDDIPAAVAYQEEGHARGKVVVAV
jgi:NADPH:quinone reductase-like Zn-dependent oxidoreductase